MIDLSGLIDKIVGTKNVEMGIRENIYTFFCIDNAVSRFFLSLTKSNKIPITKAKPKAI